MENKIKDFETFTNSKEDSLNEGANVTVRSENKAALTKLTKAINSSKSQVKIKPYPLTISYVKGTYDEDNDGDATTAALFLELSDGASIKFTMFDGKFEEFLIMENAFEAGKISEQEWLHVYIYGKSKTLIEAIVKVYVDWRENQLVYFN